MTGALLFTILLVFLKQPWYIACIPIFVYLLYILIIIICTVSALFCTILKSSNKEKCLRDIESKLDEIEKNHKKNSWF